MERIQSALAKARAAREIAEPLHASPSKAEKPTIAVEISPDAAITTAWAALPEARVDQRSLERAHVVTLIGGAPSAPFDMMRTKALHQMRAQGWRRLAITSPGPACGKSTLALNLAFGLARQAELRVILVEADLRRPTLNSTLGIHRAEGAAEMLEGGVEPGAAMLRYRKNLAFLTATGSRRSSAELLGAPSASAALDKLDATYDPSVVIFDLPPMAAGDDVMSFAGLMDCALLVAAAGSTTIKEIDACERELATRTNVMGVILNKCRYLGQESNYNY